MKYSFKKGLVKGLISALTGLAIFISFTAFSDVELWALLEQYIRPVLGSLTVGGAITMVINWLKVKNTL